MALYVNGVNPTEINVNGTSINAVKVVKDGVTTGVWGKPFNVYYSLSSGVASINVIRDASTNQNAITGSLANSATIFYGDRITITATALSGYTIKRLIVNGVEYSMNSITFSCTKDVTISAEAEVETVTASWHTVWTGSKSYYQLMATEKTTMESFTGVTSGRPTRVSGTGYNKKTTTFTEVELPAGVKTQVVSDNGTPQYITYDGGTTFTFAVKGSFANKGIVLTKIEQYY